MPTILIKDGFRFHFYTNERNEPPHIHITGKGGEMKVWIPSLVVEFSYGLSPGEQRNAMGITRQNIKLFMEKWNEFASKKN
ncbi:MAG: DUF4160 domain-containing protein [Deltaproteobacteria bacterium]|nr:DUF4160 domain-containing protein [Deltaproteobacteria bacterium]